MPALLRRSASAAPAPRSPAAGWRPRIERWLMRPVAAPSALHRVFVIGCPRSGTTVVQKALAERAALATTPETHFFRHLLGAFDDWIEADGARTRRRWQRRLLCARLRTHRELHESMTALLEGRTLPRHLSGRAYARDFVRLLDERAAARGSAGWVEKTPDHFAYIEPIGALCPGARFVHVLRRGEDVMASIADAALRHAEQRAFAGGAAHWVRRWNRAAETHLRYAGQPGHHVLFHEDLVDDSEATLQRLLDFVGCRAAPRSTQPSEIADLERWPWMRDAVDGPIAAAERKFESIFGPIAQAWIREHLVDYDALREQIGRRQR